MEYTILVIEDEPLQLKNLSEALEKQGYNVLSSESSAKGIEIVQEKAVDLVLTDFKMPEKNGLEVLREVKQINPDISVIIITAYGDVETAVKVMKEGAFDYLTKPIEFEELDIIIKKALERKMLVSENKELRRQLAGKYRFDEIIYGSSEMEEVINTAGRAADSRASILIYGESGTGKELIAKAIHYASPRKNKPLISINCAALNENLLESELFGHEKGAFTGADKQRKGRFELADGGTIFLDEVGEIPPSIQVKLLRVLQEREFERVGGNETIRVDVRVISATNRDLESMIKKGAFREDLFYRLNVISIRIPPLRERKSDIPPLINYFITKYARENNKEVESLSKEAMDALIKYNYPGNVRELENAIERAVIMARGKIITLDDLPIFMKISNDDSKQSYELKGETLDKIVENVERQLIAEALVKANNNQSRAAEILGISERNLRYKLKKYGMKK
ncbi:MAG: sigma-54-dependent transcriptional regulator [bacterium]